MKGKHVSAISIVSAAIAWETFVRTVFPPPRRYAFSLVEMLQALPELWAADLAKAMGVTLTRSVGGFLIAAIVGITVGVMTGRSTVMRQIVAPIVDFFRPLPSSALIPALMSAPMFGLKERSFYAIIVFGSVWPILFNTIAGVSRTSPTAEAAIRLLPISKVQRFWRFILPEAAPEIYAGLQISLAISVILAITAELIISGNSGLGGMMELERNSGNTLHVWTIILVIALIGWLLNTLFGTIQHYHPWLRWRNPQVSIQD